MKSKINTILLVLIFLPVVLYGVTVEKFLEECSSKNKETVAVLDKGYCQGYIAGAIDQSNTLFDVMEKSSEMHPLKKICIPRGLRLTKLKKIVVDRLNARPELGNNRASGEIIMVLIDDYGCL